MDGVEVGIGAGTTLVGGGLAGYVYQPFEICQSLVGAIFAGQSCNTVEELFYLGLAIVFIGLVIVAAGFASKDPESVREAEAEHQRSLNSPKDDAPIESLSEQPRKLEAAAEMDPAPYLSAIAEAERGLSEADRLLAESAATHAEPLRIHGETERSLAGATRYRTDMAERHQKNLAARAEAETARKHALSWSVLRTKVGKAKVETETRSLCETAEAAAGVSLKVLQEADANLAKWTAALAAVQQTHAEPFAAYAAVFAARTQAAVALDQSKNALAQAQAVQAAEQGWVVELNAALGASETTRLARNALAHRFNEAIGTYSNVSSNPYAANLRAAEQAHNLAEERYSVAKLNLAVLRGELGADARSSTPQRPQGASAEARQLPPLPPLTAPTGSRDAQFWQALGYHTDTTPPSPPPPPPTQAVPAQAVPAQAVPAQAAERYCPSCGSGNARASAFCESCGKPLPAHP